MGREFDFDTLVKASDQDEETLIDALEAAEGAQLIEEVSSKNGVTFSFAHALIPTTLVEGVRTLRRRRLHRRAAQAIEALHPEAFEELAYHFEEAGNKERARMYYTRAGKRAGAAYANLEAETYFHAALDLEPSIAERADLLSSQAEVIDRVGRHEEAIISLKEAVELYTDIENSDRVVGCYARIVRAKLLAGDIAAAVELGKQGLNLTSSAPESAERADLIHEMARTYWYLGDPARAEPLCQRALEMARRTSAKQIEVDALTTLSMLPSTKSDDAIAALKETIDISQLESMLDQEFRAHYNLAIIYEVDKAKFRLGRGHYLKSAKIARQMGDLSGELLALSDVAWSYITLGEFSKAEEMKSRLDEIRDQVVDLGRSGWMYQTFRAYFEQARGNLVGAAEQYRHIIRQLMDSGSASHIPLRSYLLSLVLLELDALDEAESVIQQGVKVADQFRLLTVNRTLTRAAQAMILARKGIIIQARQVYDEAEQIFTDDLSQWSAIALSIANSHVLAAEKRWDEALARFQETADLLANAEMRFDRSIFLQYWAQVHLNRGQEGDLESARELYREALAEFEAMGSLGYVKRIQARLEEIDG